MPWICFLNNYLQDVPDRLAGRQVVSLLLQLLAATAKKECYVENNRRSLVIKSKYLRLLNGGAAFFIVLLSPAVFLLFANSIFARRGAAGYKTSQITTKGIGVELIS